jgi:hypothetical protein
LYKGYSYELTSLLTDKHKSEISVSHGGEMKFIVSWVVAPCSQVEVEAGATSQKTLNFKLKSVRPYSQTQTTGAYCKAGRLGTFQQSTCACKIRHDNGLHAFVHASRYHLFLLIPTSSNLFSFPREIISDKYWAMYFFFVDSSVSVFIFGQRLIRGHLSIVCKELRFVVL